MDRRTRKKTFDALVNRHRLLIRRLCWLRAHGDELLYNDLSQECYATIWNSIDKLRPKASAFQQRLWVVLLCRSTIGHYLRHEPLQLVPLESVADTLKVATGNENLREAIDELAVGLSDTERKVIYLGIEGYSHLEIGIKLGVKADTVAHIRSRAIGKMRKELASINEQNNH